MPSITDPSELTAVITFTLPASRLDHDESLYLKYDPMINRPTESICVPVTDLRPELERDTLTPIAEQLAQRGFAIANHHSDLLDSIPSEEGTQRYLDETAEILRTAIGATRVISWNSTVRRNDPEKVKMKDVPMQQGPEKGFIPTSRLQPVAGVAHVDQDDVWGKELISKAAGRPADTFKRSSIINIWRPLTGPVTNAPLAMLDYRSLSQDDMAKHGHMFGVGFDIHHSAGQSWSYIRHQQSDEIIFLKCYDSLQGADRSALYAGHVAVKVDGDEEGIAPELIRPRESIEVRLVALWE